MNWTIANVASPLLLHSDHEWSALLPLNGTSALLRSVVVIASVVNLLFPHFRVA